MEQSHQTTANQIGNIHIDKIRVSGPCRHKPIGKIWLVEDETVGIVPVGASPTQKVLKVGSEEAYIKSKDLDGNGMANSLEIHCCPPAVLQRHNFFGHDSILDYIYAIFDHATRAYDIEVDPADREAWRNGKVWLTEVHLTGNFACQPSDVIPIIQAIDENNSDGKHRDEESCITLGFTPKRRSKYHAVTVYAKGILLSKQWKKTGPYQSKIRTDADRSIRAEVKLYSMGLKELELQYAAKWRDVDVVALFFQVFDKYRIKHSIQRLLTDDELQMLTTSELNIYKLWLHGEDIKDLFKSRSTVWKYVNKIQAKTGMDISGNRRPEALPAINLAEIFIPENLLPIPEWAFGTEFYFPQNQPDLPAKARRCERGIANAPLDPYAAEGLLNFDGEPGLI